MDAPATWSSFRDTFNVDSVLTVIFDTIDSVQKSGRISPRPICQSSTLLEVFCTLWDIVIC
jgi:hypothetical protein